MSSVPVSLSESSAARTPAAVRAAGHAAAPSVVLVVGADSAERTEVAGVFESQGFRTLEAVSTDAAVEAASAGRVDLVVLSGRLGDDGPLAACGRLSRSQDGPIIILSDDADVTDRVIALELGADDLIGRPFNRRELIARTRALLRRSRRLSGGAAPGTVGRDGTLYVNTRVLAGPDGARAQLARSQVALLRTFASRPGQLITSEAARLVLGSEVCSSTQMRTAMVRLRRKLAEAGLDEDCISSVRGLGYALDAGIRIGISEEDRWDSGEPRARLSSAASTQ